MKYIKYLLLIISFNSYAQDACDLLKSKELTWYGIDYTKSKMIGPDFNDPLAIKTHWFKSWNDIVLNEYDKYNLKKFFRKDIINYNIAPISKRNQLIDENNLVTYNLSEVKKIQDSDIDSLVSSYDFGKNEGFGALLIVESYNKFEEKGTYFIVFIDISKKTALLKERITVKAGGIGFRNFWASTIYNALNECGKKYKNWEKQYCK